MNARKFFLIATLFVLAIVAVACAAPTPTPMPIPTPIPPTAVPAAKPTDMPKPTVAPTVAPTKAAEPTKATGAGGQVQVPTAFDAKATLDKYFAALPDGFGLIAPAAAKDQMAATKVFLLDMREASEITTNGFVEGAVNIPTRTLMKNLDKLPAKDQPIIVMCGSGVRSPLGMAALQMLGYTNVKNLTGGFNGWKAANLPIKTDGKPAEAMAGMAPTVDKDLLAALDKWFTALPDGWNGVAPAAAKDQMAATKVTLIDVREASEVASGGKIEGSVNIPVRTLIKSLDKLPADKAAPIIVTCASGHRGMFSMMALQMLGYTNVKNITGGLNAWKTANLPVVGGAPAAAFDAKATLDKYFAALPDGFGLIAPAAAKDQMAATKVFLLDMREASEITTNGFVEGAVNIPTRTLMKNLDKLPAKDQPIIVMCGSGVRSPLGMAALQMLGYTNVKNLTGGFNGWKAANLPIKTDGKPAEAMAGMAPTVDKDLLAALDKWFTALPDGWNGVAPAAAKDQMAATKVTLIDVREASEVASGGKIEGSVNIPVRTLIKSLDKLPADKAAPIIVTCASGHRGMFSMMALQMLGYTNVKNITGGLNAWKTANLAIVQ